MVKKKLVVVVGRESGQGLRYQLSGSDLKLLSIGSIPCHITNEVEVDTNGQDLLYIHALNSVEEKEHSDIKVD